MGVVKINMNLNRKTFFNMKRSFRCTLTKCTSIALNNPKKAKYKTYSSWFLWKSFTILFNVNFFMLFQCMKCSLNRFTEKPLKDCSILTKRFCENKIKWKRQSICIILQLSDAEAFLLFMVEHTSNFIPLLNVVHLAFWENIFGFFRIQVLISRSIAQPIKRKFAQFNVLQQA